MTLEPGVQRKAQEEIDRVVGATRVPGVADRANLPYVDAVVKEILRWHPVAPMGLPHMSVEDDMWEGYFIPKGSLLMSNIWRVDERISDDYGTNASTGRSRTIPRYTTTPWHSSQSVS